MKVNRSSEQIRLEYLRFFEERGHQVVASDSLVPSNDPTLLFTNAGMNQFKDVFLGTGERPYRRAADSQKCLRVSGKHNDLEEVGLDTYHHTFFEMLGNWSFGDYFKKEAVRWAWELLVDRWGLDPSRLYATVHEGDPNFGLEPDHEAAKNWLDETSIDKDHVLYCGSKDNFWMMGDTGPCGPCSEIHIDLRPDKERASLPGATLVNANDPRIMEIWNLVFIQYNAQPGGILEPLRDKHVDTGMGFERMVAVLQGKTSNYDTDLFKPILTALSDLSPDERIDGYDKILAEDKKERDRIRIAMRVIADHVRTIAFSIADGVTPGNVGRSYVIRRILRRAVRFGYQALHLQQPFLYRLVEPLRQKMGTQFPELERHQEYIERAIRAEEENFLQTLGTGIGIFDRITPYLNESDEDHVNGYEDQRLKHLRGDTATVLLLRKAYISKSDEELLSRFLHSAKRHEVPGEIAFLLHDTYGFPIDLTRQMARENGFSVDMVRYRELMLEQKERARAASSFTVDQSVLSEWQEIASGVDSVFLGYDQVRIDEAHIMAVRAYRHEEDAQYQLILDKTPFYGESGGQVGDTGILVVGDETINVLDTKKLIGRIIHVVDRLPKTVETPVVAEIDVERRQRIKKNHTATHLLHAALREVLGKHVAQKGSLVAPDRLRFDFSHFERVSKERLREVERRVNEKIQQNVPIQAEESVPLDKALERGAVALFGEKYDDSVRVVSSDPTYSIELCGGTHVTHSGEIGFFQIVSEGSVAAGIRRIEAVTGLDALDFVEREREELERIRGLFRSLQRPVYEEVVDLLDFNKQQQKAIDKLTQQNLSGNLDRLIQQAKQAGPVRLVVGRIPDTEMDSLRSLGETLRERLGELSVGVLGTADPSGQKGYLVTTVSDDLIRQSGLKAGAIVGVLAKHIDGGGGGRPNLATAGGRAPEKLDLALAAAEDIVLDMLS